MLLKTSMKVMMNDISYRWLKQIETLISLVEEKPIAEGTRSRLIEITIFAVMLLIKKFSLQRYMSQLENYNYTYHIRSCCWTMRRQFLKAWIYQGRNFLLNLILILLQLCLMGLEPSEQLCIWPSLAAYEQLFIYETCGTVRMLSSATSLTMKLSYSKT